MDRKVFKVCIDAGARPEPLELTGRQSELHTQPKSETRVFVGGPGSQGRQVKGARAEKPGYLAGHVQIRSADLRISKEWQARPEPSNLEGRRSDLHQSKDYT